MARTYDLELSLPIHAQKKEDGKRNHQLLKQALSSDLIILLEKVYITPSSMGGGLFPLSFCGLIDLFGLLGEEGYVVHPHR